MEVKMKKQGDQRRRDRTDQRHSAALFNRIKITVLIALIKDCLHGKKINVGKLLSCRLQSLLHCNHCLIAVKQRQLILPRLQRSVVQLRVSLRHSVRKLSKAARIPQGKG